MCPKHAPVQRSHTHSCLPKTAPGPPLKREWVLKGLPWRQAHNKPKAWLWPSYPNATDTAPSASSEFKLCCICHHNHDAQTNIAHVCTLSQKNTVKLAGRNCAGPARMDGTKKSSWPSCCMCSAAGASCCLLRAGPWAHCCAAGLLQAPLCRGRRPLLMHKDTIHLIHPTHSLPDDDFCTSLHHSVADAGAQAWLS